MPCTTVSPVHCIPGWTCDSGMIAPPSASATLAGTQPAPPARTESEVEGESRPLSGALPRPRTGRDSIPARPRDSIGPWPPRAAPLRRRRRAALRGAAHCGRSTRPCCPSERGSSCAAPTMSPTRSRRLAIRGAPLIGVAAAYGVALEVHRDPHRRGARAACAMLRDARPTAVNLALGSRPGAARPAGRSADRSRRRRSPRRERSRPRSEPPAPRSPPTARRLLAGARA